MERHQLLAALSDEFYAEQARRLNDEVERQVAALVGGIHEPHTRQQQAVDTEENRDPDAEYEDVKSEQTTSEENASENEGQSQFDGDHSDDGTVKSEIASSGPSVIVIDSDSESDMSEGEKERQLQKYKELEKETLETLQRIQDNMIALGAKGGSAKSRRRPLAAIAPTAAESRKPKLSENREAEQTKPCFVWDKSIHAPSPSPSGAPRPETGFLLSFRFDDVSQLFIAEKYRTEVEVKAIPIQMASELSVTFTNSTFELRGFPAHVSRFQFISVGRPFSVIVSHAAIVVDGKILASNGKVFTYGKMELGTNDMPNHGVTLFGPAQKRIRIRYKQWNYSLVFGDEDMALIPE